MSADRLEQDPATNPRSRSCLATDLTRLVGVWGPAQGMAGGSSDEIVTGLAFLSTKPWLVIARVARERAGRGDALRAVGVPSGHEVPIPYFPDDVATKGRHRGCWSLDASASDLLLAAMSDHTVRVIDGATGEEKRRFDLAAATVLHAGPRRFIAVTATGSSRYDLPSGTATASIHDLETGAKLVALPIAESEKYLHGIVSDAAGERIVYGLTVGTNRSCLRCVDAAGAVIWETPIEHYFANGERAIAITPDGSLVAVAGWMGKLKFFDGKTGAHVRDLSESRNCASPVFSRDGQRFALSLHSRYIAIGDTGGKITGDRDGAASEAIAFAPDGTLLASGGRNGSVAFSRVPDATLVPPSPGFEIGFALDATRIALSASSEHLIADHEGTVTRRIPRVKGQERITAMTPDGRLVVQPKRNERGPIVRLDESGPATIYDGPNQWEYDATSVCAPPRAIALGIADATLVDVVTGARTELAGAHAAEYGSGDDTGEHNLTAAAVSHDGTLAATSSSDGSIALWSLPAGTLRKRTGLTYRGEATRTRADALAFSRDATLLYAVVAVHYGARLYAYETATMEVRWEIRPKPTEMVAVTPAVSEHRRLAAFATEDGVLLANPDDGRVLDTLRIGDAPALLAFAEPHLFVQTSRGQILRFRLT